MLDPGVRRALDGTSLAHLATVLPDGDAAWEIIDQIATKYTGGPYSRDQERVVAVIEPERQTAGIG